MKDIFFPRGLVPLEELFGFNDVAKKPKIEPTGVEVEYCNIDVFAWSYEDLKSYNTDII